jgi:RNA ligase (TIGR02306 family)
MSQFNVKVRKIEKIWPHPDADAMQMAKVEGLAYQSVVGLNVKAGDLVAFFPIDSVLPEKTIRMLPEVIQKKLGGVESNRVISARLRGQVSQGLAIPVNELQYKPFFTDWKKDGYDLTEELGVVKYNPPEIAIPNAKLARLPEFCPYYDIESCDVFEDVLNILMDKEVVITEKLEGVNHAINSSENTGLSICQRSYEVFPDEGKTLEVPCWKVAHDTNASQIVTMMSATLQCAVTVRSEFVGQNPAFTNYYELPDMRLYAFDVWLNGLPIDFDKEQELVYKYGIQYVPILHRGILRDLLAGQTIQEFSNGMSKINPKKKREGIVIRPVIEQSHPLIGRLILKQHSPEYKIKNKL